MTNMFDEAWLAKRMLDHRGPDVFDGVTDPGIRKQRMREAINSCGLSHVVIGAKDGKPVNWSAAFEALYGEKL